MSQPNWVRFELVNGITEKDVNEAKHIIYVHTCSDGRYVGRAADPTSRWLEHVAYASDENSPYYNDTFRAAIRRCGHARFKHYIVAVASFEKSAIAKEAAAIRFYDGNLNMKLEAENEQRKFDFRPLQGQIGRSLVLKRKLKSASGSRVDGDRKTVIAEIVLEKSRKRVKSVENPNFASGLYVECSRAEREKYNVGDKVRINVALTEKNGTKFLIAGKTSVLLPAID